MAAVPPSGRGDGPDPPVFDPSQLVEAYGALNADARELLDLFVETMTGMIRDIDALLAETRLAEAREIAHRARSASGSIGGAALKRLFVHLERALAEERSADAHRVRRQIGPAFAKLRDAIERL